MGVFCLVFGNFRYIYFYIFGLLRRKKYHLIKYTFLVPFYWLYGSLAGFYAVWGLIRNPFYWSKTKHGLHIKNKQVKVSSITSEYALSD